ncbi:hypothetical protein CEXT_446461 [Caerostris extrusa]|uniref:Uncharacterized protein n=1 Tax=Caerostris extrusa TaxID=172846 RepID=A0AAV4YAD3_CAEEX|nr:hypothetical protein CEXT_446461 [Caerostris extrusa]
MDFSICVTRVNTLHPVFPDKTGFSRPEHPDPVVYNEHEGSAPFPTPALHPGISVLHGFLFVKRTVGNAAWHVETVVTATGCRRSTVIHRGKRAVIPRFPLCVVESEPAPHPLRV